MHGGEVEFRNEQFDYLAGLKEEYLAAGVPVISMDTKKKEHLRNLYRDGRLFTTDDIEVYDHDFVSLTEGVLIPQGLYDLARNVGHINLGLSHDTSEFACDSLGWWWQRSLRYQYPGAAYMLLLCDAGGSNDARHWIFKEDLQKLSDRLGLGITVAHYPPYCSRYNPADHRLSPHVTRALQGVIFRSVDLVTRLVRDTRTSTGLSVTAHVMRKFYATKRRASQLFLDTMPVIFSDFLPQWNYTVVPNTI